MTLGGKLGIYIDYLLGGQIWKTIHEKSQRTLDTVVQLNALGITNAPATAAHGDTYIVGSAPTGAFSGQAPGVVATYHSTLPAWEFYTPKQGWVCGIGSEMYYYSGSQWLPFGSLPSVSNSASVAGAAAGNAAAGAGVAAHESVYHNQVQAYHGTSVGPGAFFVPAGTYTNQALIASRDSPSLTLTNFTTRPQLAIFNMSSEALWYGAVNSVIFSYLLIVNGTVQSGFLGNSRIPPHNINPNGSARAFSGQCSILIGAGQTVTINMRENCMEGNGATINVPVNTVYSYGGSYSYTVFNI